MIQPGQTQAAPRRRRLRRGIYLLPSLFTLGNILLGFYAVIRGLRGDFEAAGLAILAATVLDALDGRLARMTGTESDFGKEFDSLADVLTFCSAPALLAYLWGLHELSRLGWLVPVFFLVCGSVRLARFNVQARVVDPRWFVGLPTPAAAGTLAAFFFLVPSWAGRTWLLALLMAGLLALGLLMVSTFRYKSFRQLDLGRRRSYRLALLWAALLLLVVWQPRIFLVAAGVAYTLSGPGAWLWGLLRRGSGAERSEEEASSRPPPDPEETLT
jgi:CDP-diacylglycerol---serine O-phosphatidyltransferase